MGGVQRRSAVGEWRRRSGGQRRGSSRRCDCGGELRVMYWLSSWCVGGGCVGGWRQ